MADYSLSFFDEDTFTAASMDFTKATYDNRDAVLVTIDVTQGSFADIRASFYDLADEKGWTGGEITFVPFDGDANITTQDYDINKVLNLGNGANVNGVYGRKDDLPDAGVGFGNPGLHGGTDDIGSVSFYITAEGGITLEDLDLTRVVLRLTSTGADREGSAKLVGEQDLLPQATASELVTHDDGLNAGGLQPTDGTQAGTERETTTGTLLIVDPDADDPDSPDAVGITSITFDGPGGSEVTAPVDGYWVIEGAYGIFKVSATPTLNADGEYVYQTEYTQIRSYSHIDDDAGDGTGQTATDAEQFVIHVAASGDGDTNEYVVGISITDDIPSLAIQDSDPGAPEVVDEKTGTTSGTWSLTEGADGVSEVAVSFDGKSDTLTLGAGETTTITGDSGSTLVVNADGTWSFAAGAVDDNTNLGFTLSADDGDGDPTSDTYEITVKNIPDIPPEITGVDDLLVDEEGIDGSATQAAGTSPASNVEMASDTATLQTFNGSSISSITIGNVLVYSSDPADTTSSTVDSPYGTLTASYDPGTGQLQYSYDLTTDYAHPDGGGANQIANDALSFEVVVTDSNNLSSNATINVDIIDDQPIVTAGDFTGQVTIDETPGIDDRSGIDDNTASTAQISVAAGDLSDILDFGADDEGSTTYKLVLSSQGVDSGLSATDGGTITLSEANGVITGTDTQNDPVFTAAIDSSGTITLTQNEAVFHPDPTAANEIVTTAAGLIQVEVTATDRDGDSVSAVTTGENGLLIGFADDIPSLVSVDDVDLLHPAVDTIADGSTSISFDAGFDGLQDIIIEGGTNVSGVYNASTGNIDLYVDALPAPTVEEFTVEGAQAGAPVGAITLSGGGENLTVYGTDENGVPGNVNTSSGGIGIGSNNLNSGETLVFSNENPMTSLSISMSNSGSGGIFTLVYRDENGDIIAGSTQENISVSPGDTLAAGLDGQDFYSVEVTVTDGNAIKLNLDQLAITFAPDDFSEQLNATIVDGDGDYSNTVSFTVNVDANNDGLITLPEGV
ncbi:MAG: DUF5801 repeats-in-toxin domain-containing protein [Geminicoccaceae bacterium]